jgi:uncharacterized phage protein (TIGR02218 family)
MSVTPEMLYHLAGTTTLCTLVKLTERRSDGTLGDVISVCNHTWPLTYLGTTYQAVYLDQSQLQQTAGLAADNAKLVTPASGLFSTANVRGHKWVGARIEFNVVNYRDLSQGPVLRKVGTLGESTVGLSTISTELRSLSQMLNQVIGDMVTEECRVLELGNTLCGVNLAGQTEQGQYITRPATVSFVYDRQQFQFSYSSPLTDGGLLDAPNDLYLKGRVYFNSGLNQGLREDLLWNTGNMTAMFLPAPHPLAVGDAMTLIIGCNRSRAQCRDRFNNARRIRCFPDLPGRDRLFKFPGGVEG